MLVTWKDRQIDITLVGATGNYDYWCDCYIEEAYYVDTEEDVPDEIIDEMQCSGDMDDWIINWVY